MYLLSNTNQNLEDALRNLLSTALTQNEETIKRLNDINTIIDWYNKAKEDPDRIPSIIVDKMIEELLKHSINAITEKIEIQCQINLQKNEVKGNIRINAISLKPYVEFIKVLNKKEVPPPLRFTFKLDIDGNLQGLKIKSTPTISKEQGAVRREISLDNFIFDLTISIIKLPTVNLNTPIVLYHDEHIKVENLFFSL